MPDTTPGETPTLSVEERLAQVEQALLEMMEVKPAEAELVTSEPLLTMRRIVDYHTNVKSYPAIVTAVHPDDLCDLVIFGSPLGSCGTRLNVRPGGRGHNNTWSWPEPPALLPEDSDEDETGEEAGA